MSVSVTSGILDLYAPKFALDGMGIPGEKVTLRVVISSKSRKMRKTFFGNYIVGGRHAQIASRELVDFGTEVDVISVERYSLKDFIQDANRLLTDRPLQGNLQLGWDNGKTFLSAGGKTLPIIFRSMYTSAAKIWGIFECQEKVVKIALSDEIELFDLQRRKLVGMVIKDETLILERAFQHPETDS